ncbi:tetratricopeptide repeat protein [Phototrophicus methaneseepsis]|uniref:Tetratricopeptide repeat protein n=1 Tax=Phototrophicus methaneseepsis TaxID=2710758 RepID=A0A7S8E752_9CHLR|nr:tetratricopeptide repeat protein [Phototrophicus methaneseepsis]QPC81596.1 tetratricopeptide repeat protein [Phototrophicus methaneseepsis]
MVMSQAHELQDQGVQLFQQREYEAASRSFQEALDAYKEAGDENMVAEMKVNIGLVHRELGEAQQALDMMQEALRHFQNTEDQFRVAQVLGNMGGVYMALNDKEQAMTSYREAADIFRDMGEDRLYRDTLLALGSLQVREGKFIAGASLYQLGLEGKTDLNMRQRIMKRLSSIITSFSNQVSAS